MRKLVTVFGPPGSGKTRNAEKLRQHFGLKYVVDEPENMQEIEHLANKGGVLVLTQTQSEGAISISSALKQIKGETI